MKITLNWLREFVDFDLSAEELAEKFDLSGTAVENIAYLGAGLENIVVGEVLTADKHPDADRLSVCEVDIGGGEQTRIVCGAPNVAAGQKVPVALPGAVLPSGIKIKAAKIRGVASAGMICSETELGLAEESAGIMVLEGDPKPGDAIAAVLGFDDWLLELEITPNRPDCMGMIGVAREVAALVGGSVRRPEALLTVHPESIETKATVEIKDPDLCPRYCARFVDNVTVGPAPYWMRRRLEAVGIRSINNVVDVTNYVLIETGQPLHAFDYRLLRGGKIVVRRAKPGETLETIDHVVRTLEPDHLVIADAERAVALAGVMGGMDSEINDKTTEVLIESANFHAPNIRKTSRSMVLISESSLRFERGVDISGTIYAAERAAQLMAEIAGGRIWTGLIDNYPVPREPRTIELRPQRVHEVLGIGVEPERFASILRSLELEVGEETDADNVLRVTVPTFRVDLEREIDLIEEIARFYGLNNIETGILPSTSEDRGLSPMQTLVRNLRDIMIAAGLTEVINYSFIGQNELDRLALPADDPWATAPRIANPLSEDQALMRTTLLSSLMQTVAYNYKRGQKDLSIFEIGNVFREAGEVPEQSLKIGGALTGRIRPSAWYDPDGAEADFYSAKGLFELICDKLALNDCRVKVANHPVLSSGRAAKLVSEAGTIGIFGALHPAVQDNYGLKQPVFVFEADITRIFESARQKPSFSEIQRFPAVIFDLALIVDDKMGWGSLENLVKQTGGPLLKQIHLFDLYRGPGVPEGQKSLAFNLTFQSPERTLTDDEVDRIQKRIVKRAEHELGARLRD
jgi:phenylalanyl-tRNA synthetase beta chain